MHDRVVSRGKVDELSVRKRLLAAGAALLATTSLVAVTPQPAAAVGCVANSICLHDPHNYGLPLDSWPADYIRTHRCVNVPAAFNNKTTSWRNTSRYRFVAYDAANCGGVFAMYTLFPNYSSPNVGVAWNDKLTSVGLG